MHTLSELRSMLDAHGLSPRKALGQNFLIDRNLGAKLVDEAGVARVTSCRGRRRGRSPNCSSSEAARSSRARWTPGWPRCARPLPRNARERYTLIEGDCLARKRELNPAIVGASAGRPFTLVANLPYNAASPLMAVLLTDFPNCRAQYVTIQKEVGERLAAKPGGKEYGPLTVIAQALATVRRVAVLPPECFWPRPG